MLKSIVDPRVAYLAISFFNLLSCVSSVCASQSMAFFIGYYDLDSIRTPAYFGWLISTMAIITIFISVPLFYIAGKQIIAQKHRGKVLKMTEVESVQQSNKASEFFRSIVGGNLMFLGEMKPSTF